MAESQTSNRKNGTERLVFGQMPKIGTKSFGFWTIGPKNVQFKPKSPITERSYLGQIS